MNRLAPTRSDRIEVAALELGGVMVVLVFEVLGATGEGEKCHLFLVPGMITRSVCSNK